MKHEIERHALSDSNPLLPSFDMDFTAPHLRVLDALLRASPNMIFVQDRSGRLVYAGLAVGEAVGLPPEEMLGKTLADIGFSAEQIEAMDRQREQVFVTEHPLNGEAAFQTVKGLRDFVYTLSPVQDGNGETQAVLCMARDVTESRMLDRERQSIMAAARCLLWYADIYETGVNYLHWDIRLTDPEAAQRFLPLDKREGEAYKDAWYRSRPEEDRDRCDVLGTASIRDGRSYEQEFRCLDRDGGMRWLHEAIRVETVIEGRQWRAIGVCTDITEQKRHEAQLADLNERLKRGVQETHHRVKNNLQMLSSLLDMAVMDHEEALPLSEVRRLALQIRTLAGIHDILTHDAQFARASDASAISVQVMLSRLVTMLQSTAERHRIEQGIDDLRLSIQKATALSLVTNELVSNAVKHGQAWVRVRFRVEENFARLIVEDDGLGLPEGFDLVTAAHTGLALVETLAKYDLGGTLTFENRTEGGARVIVTLPVRP